MESLQFADVAGWAVGLAFLFGFITLIVVTAKQEKKRIAELAALARRLGMDFQGGGEGLEGAPFYDFSLFEHGRSRKTTNVFRETRGESQTAIFEYRYTTGGGKNSHTYRQTVAAFKKPGASLPQFSMAPENFFHRIGEKFGMQDIDFSGNEVFSRSYLLKGQNENDVKRLFEGNLVRYFARNAKWNIEGEGEWLIVYRSGRRPKVVEVPAFVKEAIDVAREFEFV